MEFIPQDRYRKWGKCNALQFPQVVETKCPWCNRPVTFTCDEESLRNPLHYDHVLAAAKCPECWRAVNFLTLDASPSDVERRRCKLYIYPNATTIRQYTHVPDSAKPFLHDLELAARYNLLHASRLLSRSALAACLKHLVELPEHGYRIKNLPGAPENVRSPRASYFQVQALLELGVLKRSMRCWPLLLEGAPGGHGARPSVAGLDFLRHPTVDKVVEALDTIIMELLETPGQERELRTRQKEKAAKAAPKKK